MKIKHKIKVLIFSLFALVLLHSNAAVKAKTDVVGGIRIKVDEQINLNDKDGIELSVTGKEQLFHNLEIVVIDHDNLVHKPWDVSDNANVSNMSQWNWQKVDFNQGPGSDYEFEARTTFVPKSTGAYNISVRFTIDGTEYSRDFVVNVNPSHFYAYGVHNHMGAMFVKLADTSAEYDTVMLLAEGYKMRTSTPMKIKVYYDQNFSYQRNMVGLENKSAAYQKEHLAGAKYLQYTFHGGVSNIGTVTVAPVFHMPEGLNNYQARVEYYFNNDVIYSTVITN